MNEPAGETTAFDRASYGGWQHGTYENGPLLGQPAFPVPGNRFEGDMAVRLDGVND